MPSIKKLIDSIFFSWCFLFYYSEELKERYLWAAVEPTSRGSSLKTLTYNCEGMHSEPNEVYIKLHNTVSRFIYWNWSFEVTFR